MEALVVLGRIDPKLDRASSLRHDSASQELTYICIML